MSQLPMMEDSSKPMRTRSDVLAHLAAAKRAESLTPGSSADDRNLRTVSRRNHRAGTVRVFSTSGASFGIRMTAPY